MSSLFVYKLTTMLSLNCADIRELEGMIREFIWGGRRAKIDFKIL